MEYLYGVISNYSPFSSLLQYVFHRIMGKYLKHDISMSNFALGTCILKNLDLASEKINENMLKDSPFFLYQGHIGKFNLKIPWTNILQESIAITIEDLELWLFCKDENQMGLNKSEAIENNMMEDDAENEEEDEKELYDTKVDVFKRIVNKILLNMTIDITSIRIRLFHSEAALRNYFSSIISTKRLNNSSGMNGQCFLLKIGRFSIKKQQTEEKIAAGTSILLDGIENFYLDIKELSAHILEEPYEEKSDFFHNLLNNKLPSFHYPNISHPSTFLALSSGISLHFQKRKNSDEVTKIKLFIDKGEITLDSNQISFMILLFGKADFYMKNNKKEEALEKLENIDSKDQLPLQRNRSMSLTNCLKSTKNSKETQKKDNQGLVKKGSAIIEKKEEAPLTKAPNLKKEESLLKSTKLNPNLLKSVCKKKANNEDKDLLKVVIQDYFQKTENLEFSIKLFEKPNISSLSQPPNNNNLPQNPSPFVSEENKLINKAELLLDLAENSAIDKAINTVSKASTAKIEININVFHINLLQNAQNKEVQDLFGRPWLYSSDPLVEKSSAKTHSKYQFCFPTISYQLIMKKFWLNGKLGQDFHSKIEKLKLISVEAKDTGFNFEDSDIFHSVASSLKMSFLNQRRIERCLKFFELKKNNLYTIKEIFRLDGLKNEKKPAEKKGNKELGFLLQRIKVYDKFELEEKQIEKSGFSFTFKKIENSAKISMNPILIDLDFTLLNNFSSILKDIQQGLLKETEEKKNLESEIFNSLNLSTSRHHKISKQSSNLPHITLNLHGISLALEGKLHIFLEEINLMTLPMTQSCKLSFEGCRLAYKEYLVLTCFGRYMEKNSLFFQKEKKPEILKDKMKEGLDISEKNCEFLMKNKNCLGIFLRNLNFFFFNEIIKEMIEFSEELQIKMKLIQNRFDDKNSNIINNTQNLRPIKFYCSFIVQEITMYINEKSLISQKQPWDSFYLSSQYLKDSLILSLFGLQIIAVTEENEAFSTIYPVWAAIEDIFLYDGGVKEIQLDCPLKLVQGIKGSELKKSVKEIFLKKFKGFEKLEGFLIYKQMSLMKEKSNEEKEFFSDFQIILNKNSCFKLFFIKKSNEKIIEFEIKGLVLKPDLSLGFVNRLMNLKEVLPQQQKNQESSGISEENIENMEVSQIKGSFNSICIDIFPYYSPGDILLNPDIFHLRHQDLDPLKQGLFYSNTRSVFLINGLAFNAFLDEKKIEESKVKVSLKTAKFCLLQYFDFFIESNPLIFCDPDYELHIFYDTILENLGFMPIFEISDFEIQFNKSVSISMGLFSLDFCQDSLRIVPKHLKNVLLNLNSLEKKNSIENEKKLIEKSTDLNVEKKGSFVLIDEEELFLEEQREKDARIYISNFLKEDPFFIKEGCSICVKFQSLVIKIYDGADFDFEIKNAQKSGSNQTKSKENNQNQKEKVVILNDYFSNKTKKIPTKYTNKSIRIRSKIRDLQRFVSVNCDSIFLTATKIQDKPLEILFSMKNFDVVDYISTSNIHKILTNIQRNEHILEDNPAFLHSKIILAPINKELSELSIFLRLESFQVFLNGINVQFLMLFFSNEMNSEEESLFVINEYYGQNNYDDLNEKEWEIAEHNKIDVFKSHQNIFSNEFKEKEKQINEKSSNNKSKNIKINTFFIEEFQISIDYDATYSHLNLVLQNSLNLINIGNIRGLKLFFKEIFYLDQPFETDFFSKIVEIWKSDIMSNQKPMILKRLPYINNLFRLLEGFTDIFYLPYREIKAGNSIENGILNGLGSFAKAISLESLNLTEVIGGSLGFGMKKLGVSMKRQRNLLPKLLEKARGIIDPEEANKKEEKYKKK